MRKITVRNLRNHGGRVVERVRSGEHLIVTRDGQAVAELRPLPRQPLDAATLLTRWRSLPHVDARQLRKDIDERLDPSLRQAR